MKTVSSPSTFFAALASGGSRVGSGNGYSCCSPSVIVAKKSNIPNPPSAKGSDPPPPRITSNVKQNLQFLRSWKEFQKRKYATPKPATRYRKKKTEKEDVQDDSEESELYRERDPTLSLYNTNKGLGTAVPVLLVDGYNVCGYWMKLKKHFMNGELDVARQKLIDELVTFSTIREVKVVVVFDAMMSGLPTHQENFAGIDVVYSGETCADAWIEKEVAVLKDDGCPKVWVATSDVCEQHAAYGAGAFIWSCKALVSEIKAGHQELEQKLQEQRTTSMQGKLLKHNLDPEVVDALKDMRKKLSATETKKTTSMQGKLLKHNLNPEVVDALKDMRKKLSATESMK